MTMKLNVVDEILTKHINKLMVITMDDRKVFRGTLKEFDEEGVVIVNALELIESHWKEPRVASAEYALKDIPKKNVNFEAGYVRDIREEEKEMVKFNKLVIIRLHITRLWPWISSEKEIDESFGIQMGK